MVEVVDVPSVHNNATLPGWPIALLLCYLRILEPTGTIICAINRYGDVVPACPVINENHSHPDANAAVVLYNQVLLVDEY